jgi:hypothetical protein
MNKEQIKTAVRLMRQMSIENAKEYPPSDAYGRGFRLGIREAVKVLQAEAAKADVK